MAGRSVSESDVAASILQKSLFRVPSKPICLGCRMVSSHQLVSVYQHSKNTKQLQRVVTDLLPCKSCSVKSSKIKISGFSICWQNPLKNDLSLVWDPIEATLHPIELQTQTLVLARVSRQDDDPLSRAVFFFTLFWGVKIPFRREAAIFLHPFLHFSSRSGKIRFPFFKHLFRREAAEIF